MSMHYQLYLVAHTHWDREWYEPFAVFRDRLVALIDLLLDILARDPQYRYFMLDGQTVVLEDYLEIRPERRAELEAHIRSGRILVGPWYILPDEFLASPEAIVRNLLRGHRIAQEFGAVMRVGYIPDPFGHIGQVPQILRGFGIDSACLRRGLDDHPCELVWEAPDESRVFLIYLRDGYDNAAWLPEDEDGFLEGVRRATDSLRPHARTPYLLLMHGTDHMQPRPWLTRAIAQANGKLEAAQIVQATLPDYIQKVRQHLDEDALPIVRGELRSPKRHHLLPGVLSTRLWIKQRNAQGEGLLERWAEPALAWAASLNSANRAEIERDRSLLRQAWVHLLNNQPHDSICGCSIDQVHREMVIRFDRSQELAQRVIADGLAHIADQIDTSRLTSEEVFVVFNPTTGPRSDGVEMELAGGAEAVDIRDEAGRPVPVHIVGRSEPGLRVAFLAEGVPSYGYKAYALQRIDRIDTSPSGQTPHLENEYLSVEVERDGRLTLHDKVTGVHFPQLNHFVDGGDRGDEYNFCPPPNDLLIERPSQPPTVRWLENGPARQVVEISTVYHLPATLSQDRRARSEDTVEVPITSRLTLWQSVPRLDIQTMIENRAQDHRLRVHFPTPFRIEQAHAEGAFEVVERSTKLPTVTEDWIEQPVPTAPMRGFVDVSDGNAGLLLAARGLPEYEVIPGPRGATIALTLLRCVGWLSRDDFPCRRGHAGPMLETPEAQCLGGYSFEYALIPHAGDWRDAFQQAHAFATPLRVVTITRYPGGLPSALSFLEIKPRELVVSAIKLAEEGNRLIVRLYNVDDRPIQGRLRLYRRFSHAWRTNLNEEILTELSPQDDVYTLAVRSHEIVTLAFEP
ncbi:MAG: hypothetical protein HYZ68_05675 [Chloroflexi bacterium]|nr:hypothetical protein [Chloroflexota bacterium]